MEKSRYTYQLITLSRALGAFGDKLPQDQAAKGAELLVEAMEKTYDAGQLSDLGRAMGQFQSVRYVNYEAAVELLKHLLVVDDIRQSVLKYAGRGANQDFVYLQDFVNWVKKNRKDIDLESAPQIPLP